MPRAISKFYNIGDIINGKYKILDRNNSHNDNKALFECIKCNNKFTTSIHEASRKNINNCPFCEISSKNATLEQIEYKLKQANEDYEIIEFHGLSGPSVLKHNICGHIVDNVKIWSILKRNNHKCRFCNHLSFAYTSEFVRDEIKKLTNGEYVVLSDYKREAEPIKFKHIKCGTEWFTTRRNFVYNHTRCPLCWRNISISKTASNIQKFFEENEIRYISEYHINELNRMRFDFYLVGYDLYIEYDGSQHFKPWHKLTNADSSLILTHCRDIEKNNFCIKNNLRLFRFSYRCKFDKIISALKEYFETKELSSTTIENCRNIYDSKHPKHDNYYDEYNDYITINNIEVNINTESRVNPQLNSGRKMAKITTRIIIED